MCSETVGVTVVACKNHVHLKWVETTEVTLSSPFLEKVSFHKLVYLANGKYWNGKEISLLPLEISQIE